MGTLLGNMVDYEIEAVFSKTPKGKRRKMEKKKEPKIEITAAKSSSITGHGYDEKTSTMALQFKTGVYHYPGVTKKEYDELVAAKSLGKHFFANIKGRFTGKKIR